MGASVARVQVCVNGDRVTRGTILLLLLVTLAPDFTSRKTEGTVEWVRDAFFLVLSAVLEEEEGGEDMAVEGRGSNFVGGTVLGGGCGGGGGGTLGKGIEGEEGGAEEERLRR